jgi:hypothetical protein
MHALPDALAALMGDQNAASGWPTALISLATALIGAVAGAAAAHWLGRSARAGAAKHRAGVEHAQSRDKAGNALGPLRSLLGDAYPATLAVNAGPQSKQVLADIRSRWVDIRDELASYGHAHPRETVGAAANQLTIAVGNALTSVTWCVNDLLNHTGDGQRSLAIARNDHARAIALLDVLDAAARGHLADDAEFTSRVAQIERDAEARESDITNA